MSKLNSIDWEEVYNAFDGTMIGCKGGDCFTPCCRVKTNLGVDGEEFRYNTILRGPDEFEALVARGVNFKELGVVVDSVRIRMWGKLKYVTTLKGCLGVSGCKLKENKPVACRVFPFKMSSNEPLDRGCPALRDVVVQEGLCTDIRSVRELLGYNGQEWERNLSSIVDFLLQE